MNLGLFFFRVIWIFANIFHILLDRLRFISGQKISLIKVKFCKQPWYALENEKSRLKFIIALSQHRCLVFYFHIWTCHLIFKIIEDLYVCIDSDANLKIWQWSRRGNAATKLRRIASVSGAPLLLCGCRKCWKHRDQLCIRRSHICHPAR